MSSKSSGRNPACLTRVRATDAINSPATPTQRLRRRLLAAACLLVIVAPQAWAGETCLGPTGAVATGTNSVACGTQARATLDMNTAIGAQATAEGFMGTSATAVGFQAVARYINSVAIGARAKAIGNVVSSPGRPGGPLVIGRAVAVGADANAAGYRSTAVGTGAWADGPDGVALGAGARVTGLNATAIGTNASATGLRDATAIGHGAQATGTSSVALGQGSIATRADSVSVGSAGNERQIVNVADATEATDAVNLRQMNFSFDRAMAVPLAAVNDLRVLFDDRFHVQDKRIDQIGAMNAAMSLMSASVAGIQTQNRVAVGAGFSGGEHAFSVGYQRAINERASLTVGGASSSSESSAGVAVGFGW